ncbi:MAG: Glutamine synthetase [Pseudomonadota bacterium]|jgi:glutamine synthetase
MTLSAPPDRLRVLFCDHLNLARGKYLPASKLGLDGGARFCRSTFGVTYDKDLIAAPGAGVTDGLPDMEAHYHAADMRPGWEPHTQVVVGSLLAADGSSLPMCGRSALQRAVADWQALGYQPMVGIELEAYAFQIQPDGSLTPYHTPSAYVYSTGPFADPLGFCDAIWERATRAGFRIDSMHTEFDSPQFEFTLTYDSALQAIDDVFLFRLLARETAIQHGIVLTFLPKPIHTQGGSGVHVNFSLRDAQGHSAMAGGDQAPALNALTRGCIAGLMQHHQGMAALVAPTVNSYHRLQPASMSGYWQNWGVDHRGVTARVSAEGGPAARLEHRMGDGAANPYTLTATVLQAARLGLVHGYALGPAEGGDGFVQTDARVGVPATLGAALDALEADSVLSSAVGAGLVANHVAIKRNEVDKTAGLQGAAERDFYVRFI